MRAVLLALSIVLWLSGCAANTSGADVVYELKLQANGVPASARYLEPQVSVFASTWKAAEPIQTADLSGLMKRDPVTVLLVVDSGEAGSRVAAAARLLDENKQLVAVGGGQLALYRDSTLPISLVEVSDARRQSLQLAKVVPSASSSGRTVTLYGWGFSPEATIELGGQPVTDKQWMSSVEWVVKVPSGISAGPVEIKISNPGGTSDTRADLFSVSSF